jgi:hypothetical protein
MCRYRRYMSEQPEKSAWVRRLRRHGSEADDLAPLTEQDNDPFEASLYEAAADPAAVKNEQEQRRYRAMYRRRLRRFGGRNRHGGCLPLPAVELLAGDSHPSPLAWRPVPG